MTGPLRTDEKSTVQKLRERADRWQPWIDDDLEAEVGYLPEHMRYHQKLDRDSADEIERLERDRSEWSGIAAQRNRTNALLADDRDTERTKRLQAQHERDCAVEDVARLVERERRAAIVLATALAGGGLPEQAHWLHDAAVWLNDRRPVDVGGGT